MHCNMRGFGMFWWLLHTNECKINFAVPPDTTLKTESSKYSNATRSEVSHSCLNSFSLANPNTDIQVSIDGKNLRSFGDPSEGDEWL